MTRTANATRRSDEIATETAASPGPGQGENRAVLAASVLFVRSL
jgi:hypothetical protein